ncbi:Rieske (2Fe-2S) protein [Nitrospirillum sp. BR 11752]|uniref:Rieske (2Fe-2S) protein n=1 Tax=Nitrospirillum sp. BR 11752 TaxID=3104293 RepID=UPI002EA8AFFD|nr:Rieske (2Fe-2S) protein [Nitrospirillum sp. BR 11752]
MPDAVPSPLCRLDDIPDGQAKGINWGSGADRQEILVARRGGAVFAYHNRCPHVGTTLDWTPDQFMSADGQHLQCATHGALFRVDDGLCLRGPCAGRGLTPVAVRVKDGALYLDIAAA